MKERKARCFTIHYSDGKHQNLDRGLLASISPCGDVEIKTVGLDTPQVLTILVGLQMAIEKQLAGECEEHGPDKP